LSLKEWRIQCRLKRRYLHGQGGLRDAQTICRSTKTTGFSNRLKISDLLEGQLLQTKARPRLSHHQRPYFHRSHWLI
jgi:hypothetical protein